MSAAIRYPLPWTCPACQKVFALYQGIGSHIRQHLRFRRCDDPNCTANAVDMDPLTGQRRCFAHWKATQ